VYGVYGGVRSVHYCYADTPHPGGTTYRRRTQPYTCIRALCGILRLAWGQRGVGIVGGGPEKEVPNVTAEVWREVQERQKKQEEDRRKNRVATLKERAEKVMAHGRGRGIPHERDTNANTEGGK